MFRQLRLKKTIWIDILKPTNRDIDFLRKNFNFHSVILNEIKRPTYHPLIENYQSYLFWILHFPSWIEKNGYIVSQEVDFLIVKDTVITIRYSEFNDFNRCFEIIKKEYNNLQLETSSHLFYHIIKFLFDHTFPELDRIKKEVDRIEKIVFMKFEENIIEKMAKIKFNIIDFIKVIKPHQSIWNIAQQKALKFWGDQFKPYFSDLLADYSRILHIAETYREVIDVLYSSVDAILANKRNYIIKILTIFTAIILPLSLVTSLYGMNLEYLPFAKHSFAFWGFIIFMLLASFLGLIYFKYKKWL